MLILRALVFDVDGTLAETERGGHLPACNDAFAALGLPIQWTWEEYKTLLPISGNEQRARLAMQHFGLPAGQIEALAPEFVKRKRQFYIEKYLPQVRLRHGIRQLLQDAFRRGIRLAIVSTSMEAQIHALLQAQLPDLAPYFDPVLGANAGEKTAPDSPVYRQCAERFAAEGIASSEILVIEDAAVGARAAHRAGLACAVFYNDYTFGEDFRGAHLVARSIEFFNLDLLTELCLAE